MIRQCVRILPTLLVVGMLITSCNHKNNSSDNITFDSIKVNKTVYLLGDTALPSCNIDINYTYPIAKDSTLQDSIDYYLILNCFGSDYIKKGGINLSAAELVDKYVQNYTHIYIKDVQPLYVEEIKEHPEDKPESFGWFSYFKEIKSDVAYQNAHLLVYRCYINEFTGGAHGVYFTNFFNIDLNTNRRLLLSDIFTGDYQEAVSNLIWEALMKKENVKSRDALEDMGYGALGPIMPIDNFYLSPQGITFYYNIYDIAPFAMGPTEVMVPYSQLKPWLSTIKVIEQLAK